MSWTPADDPVTRPCPSCWLDDFWRSVSGRLICRRCHPPAPGADSGEYVEPLPVVDKPASPPLPALPPWDPILLPILQEDHEYADRKAGTTSGMIAAPSKAAAAQRAGNIGRSVIARYRKLERTMTLIDPEHGRLRVKTKQQKGRPTRDYMHNVHKAILEENFDGLVFCTATYDLSALWLCGWMTKARFMTPGVSIEREKGEWLTPTYEVKEDSRTVTNDQLDVLETR